MIPAFLNPALGFVMKNPWKTALAVAVVIIGIYAWRTDYLNEKVSGLAYAITGYQKTVDDLQKDSALRDGLAHEDAQDSVQNERERARIIGRIDERNKDEKRLADPVIRDSIGWLYGRKSGTTNNQD